MLNLWIALKNSNLQKTVSSITTLSDLRYGALQNPPVWHIGGLADVLARILPWDFMNRTTHLFNGVDALVGLALANTPFKRACRRALALWLFSIFHGIVVSLWGSSWRPWKVLKQFYNHLFFYATCEFEYFTASWPCIMDPVINGLSFESPWTPSRGKALLINPEGGENEHHHLRHTRDNQGHILHIQ